MPGCSAKRCGKNSSKKDQCDEKGNKITFHQFPSLEKRYEQWKSWVEKVRLAGKGDLWKPNINAKLCSLHFEDQFLSRGFTKDGTRPLTTLTDNAVPTIFPVVPKKKNDKVSQPTVRASARKVQCSSAKELDALVQEVVQDDNVYTLPDQIVEQIAENLPFLPDTFDIFTETDEDGIVQTFYTFATSGDQQLPQGEGKSKMVTLPDTEGGQTRIILPNMQSLAVAEEVSLPPPPAPPLESSVSDGSIQATTSKVVTLGAQPFNADEQDGSDRSAEVAGTSSSDDACCSDQCRPFDFDDMACGDGKGESSPGATLTQAIELLQFWQVELMGVLPPDRLKGLCQMLEDLSLEGNSLVREYCIATEQIRACKRISKKDVSNEEGLCPRKKDWPSEDLEEEIEQVLQEGADEKYPNDPLALDDWDAMILASLR